MALLAPNALAAIHPKYVQECHSPTKMAFLSFGERFL